MKHATMFEDKNVVGLGRETPGFVGYALSGEDRF